MLSFVLFGSVHYALKSYFDNASREVVESWYANELTNIQQGNVLSSVTKLQRIIERSTLLKGVRVVDSLRGYELLRFGKIYEVSFKKNISTGLLEEDVGLFRKVYALKSGNNNIYIITESRGMLMLVGVLGLYLSLVSLGFAIFLRQSALTEEKTRSELNLQQQKLEHDFNKKIANLSLRIAHDIRSPLSALNIISDKMKTDFPEAGVLLGEASKRIIKIADGLLEASRRPESNKQNLVEVNNIKPVSNLDVKEILKIVDQAVIEKRLVLGLEKIRMEIYNEVNCDFKVLSEELVLSRIITNLLNNSVESIVNTGFISLTLSDVGDGLIIEIRDSGAGMSKELIAKAFEGPITEGKDHGNGIGLWSAIESVKSWQGQLKIHSDLGTTISIFLKKVDND